MGFRKRVTKAFRKGYQRVAGVPRGLRRYGKKFLGSQGGEETGEGRMPSYSEQARQRAAGSGVVDFKEGGWA